MESLVQCVGLAPYTAFRFQCEKDEESLLLRSLFQQETVKRGILTQGSHMLSLAHTEEVANETLDIYQEALEIIGDAARGHDARERLEGAPVRPIIRQI